MKTKQTHMFATVAGFIITSIAIVAIAVLLVPEQSRSMYFWHRVMWAEFLALLWWGGLAGFFLSSSRGHEQNSRAFAGIAPGLVLALSAYVVVSLVAMLVHAFVPESNIGNRLHLIVQIVAGASFGLLAVFFMFAKSAAAEQTVFDETVCPKPSTLCDVLAMHEARLASLPSVEQSQMLTKAVKRIREALRASLPESTACSESPVYQSFTKEIDSFCSTLPNAGSQSEPLEADCLNRMLVTANDLHAKVKYVASQLVRR